MRGMLTLNLSFLVQSIAIARPTIAHTALQQTGALRDFDPGHVRFSNRPFRVKRFQTIHLCGVDVAHGLVLLFGIGTKALPSWGSRRGGTIFGSALPLDER